MCVCVSGSQGSPGEEMANSKCSSKADAGMVVCGIVACRELDEVLVGIRETDHLRRGYVDDVEEDGSGFHVCVCLLARFWFCGMEDLIRAKKWCRGHRSTHAAQRRLHPRSPIFAGSIERIQIRST